MKKLVPIYCSILLSLLVGLWAYGVDRIIFELVSTGGLFIGVILSFFGNTPKKKSLNEELVTEDEEPLVTRENLLNQIIENIGEGLFVYDPNMKLILANRKGKVLFREEDLDINMKEKLNGLGVFLPDESEPCAVPRLPMYRAVHGEVFDGVEIIVKNAKVTKGATLLCSGRPIYNEKKEIVAGVVTTRNITSRRVQDERMRETQKLAALGEMAGGIAHEMNNPLAIIKGIAEKIEIVMSMGDYKQEEITADLESIGETVMRMKRITNGLRRMARNAHDEPFETISVKKILEDTMSFSSEIIKNKGVDLRIDWPTENVEIDCRSTQIQQVLLNLLNNAVDAIEEFEKKWIKVKVVDSLLWVELKIVDCGNGISDAVAKKMTQPFFTTKGVEKGTGLGLSIANSIASAHNGYITIGKEEGHTCISVILPKERKNDGSLSGAA